MKEFSNIKFVPRNKYKLMEETNFVIETIEKIRPKLSTIFDNYTPQQKVKEKLENNNNIIYVALTNKIGIDNYGERIGCLLATKYNELVIVLYEKAIKDMLKENDSKTPDSHKYHILFETLIHELCHIYIDNEDENMKFCNKIMNELGIPPILNKK